MNRKSFSILHEKIMSIVAYDLCFSKDLICVITVDSQICVFRTISWERVLTKSFDDLNSSYKASIVRWNYSGNLIAIGFEDGSICVLNVETENCTKSFHFLDHQVLSVTSILYVHWSQFQHKSTRDGDGGDDSNGDINNVHSHNHVLLSGYLVEYGGLHQVNRFGMATLPDSYGSVKITSSSSSSSSIFESTQLLLTLLSNYSILAYLDGVYPLFQIHPFGIEIMKQPKIQGYIGNIKSFLIISDTTIANTSSTITIINSYLNYTNLSYIQHIANLLMVMNSDLCKLQDSIHQFSKKWKEATKVIIPKMQLLQTVLDGYMLPLHPIEFMFTISQCGLWHPAATSSFPNHWNEQGINRLKSGIESTLSSLIKYLTLSSESTVANILIATKEIIGIFKHLRTQNQDNHLYNDILEELQSLYSFTLILLQKVEDARDEARLAKENMSVFLQFIKEYSCHQSNTQLKQTSNINHSVRKKFSSIFDPRIPRATLNGSNSQAEVVSCSSLYKYLAQPGLFLRDNQHINEQPSEDSIKSIDILESMKEISKLVSEVMQDNKKTSQSSSSSLSSSSSSPDIFYSDYSLIYSIKQCIEVNKSISSLLFNEISTILSKSMNPKNIVLESDLSHMNFSSISSYINRIIFIVDAEKLSNEYEIDLMNSTQFTSDMIFSTYMEGTVLNPYIIVKAQPLVSTIDCQEVDIFVWKLSLSSILDTDINSIHLRLSQSAKDVVDILLLCQYSNDQADMIKYRLKRSESFKIPSNLLNEMNTLSVPITCVENKDIQSRRFHSMKEDITSFQVCGQRAIALIGTANNQYFIIDIENNEEEDEEDEDEEENI